MAVFAAGSLWLCRQGCVSAVLGTPRRASPFEHRVGEPGISPFSSAEAG
jgi:hypothetical protein